LVAYYLNLIAIAEFCGYCYYNNVGLAAQHALDNKNINRILIVDWDIHHGQATQQMFYDDPRFHFILAVINATNVITTII